jgi:hypothetical protein
MIKLTQVVEKEYEDLTLNIKFSIDDNKRVNTQTYFSYTCPNCSGYGCRSGCDSRNNELDLSKFQLPIEVSNQIKEKLRELSDMLK